MDDVKKSRFHCNSITEQANMKISAREKLAGESEPVAQLLRQPSDWNCDATAVCRVADTGVRLRRKIKKSGANDIEAVHFRTGRGALLPAS